jgi:hypothetical protein
MQTTRLALPTMFGPNTPEWQVWAAAIFMLISIGVVVEWGSILEQRYTGPYILIAAASCQKWKWAAIIMFWQTLLCSALRTGEARVAGW